MALSYAVICTKSVEYFPSIIIIVIDNYYHIILLEPHNLNKSFPMFRIPALLLVSKQIHEEASPIYYGQNCFDIYINYSHEGVSPLYTWDLWSKYCSVFSSHIKWIRCLSLWYQDGPMGDPGNDYLCVNIRNGQLRDFDPDGSYKDYIEPEQRIGNDKTDWNNGKEVLGCVRRVLDQLKPGFAKKKRRRALVRKVAHALSEFARHCHGGEDLWIELICDTSQENVC
ncbi:hypothetical protein PFICI_12463 [Pestalotiopsis fici W106-1]|uniref:Uncharacterized protein n=1 Tax=Pestalotiopsis fici (strain W106-1 / CGMCC3.15140) TaxID=1229662 RepID=W3WNZ6_PESFW|nr:uncharacterized protein PFICI_12463 [Pestalotiopsis fici W106-1]ETS75519.1 hypothetical protein PFICI_12463 [Pestalotiopsis fici W106-1]